MNTNTLKDQSGTETIDRIKNAGAGVVGAVKDEVKVAANAVADFAGSAKEKAKEYAHEAGDVARHSAEKVQKWAGDAYDATADVAGDFGKECVSFVKKYPVPALLVGFGLGMLVGRVSRV